MQITAAAERTIDAPAAHVYELIRDFRQHHPNFLPSAFSDFQVEVGGVGAGTVHSLHDDASAGAPPTTACASASHSPAAC